MKIAIVSDSHDNWEALGKTIKIANNEKCQFLLFAGDLISPPGINVLKKFAGKIKIVWGNNEGCKTGIINKINNSRKLKLHGEFFEGKVGKLRVFMSHYPKLAELAAKSGEFDLCVCGHTHTFEKRKIKNRILINPGTIHYYDTKSPSFVIFDTQSKKAKKISL